MAKYRIERINEEIQKEMSSLLRTVKDPRVQQAMVTITHVDTTSDLRYCKIFVSALNKEQEKELMRGLKSSAKYLRWSLGQTMNLRYTPELQFFADDSIEYGTHILSLLRRANVVSSTEQRENKESEDKE